MKNLIEPVRAYGVGASGTPGLSVRETPPIKTGILNRVIAKIEAGLRATWSITPKASSPKELHGTWPTGEIRTRTDRAPPLSIVVLPFVNLGQNREEDYFATA